MRDGLFFIPPRSPISLGDHARFNPSVRAPKIFDNARQFRGISIPGSLRRVSKTKSNVKKETSNKRGKIQLDRPFEISRLKFEKILAILSSFVIKREKKVLKLILGNLENVIDRNK